ncbi:MAG: HD-GYP domain-containing protein, partial [Methanomassiliicoccales archaeon]
MHRVHTKNLHPGMEVARNIYDAENHILLAAGIMLTEKQITRIGELGVGSVYVQDEASEVEVPDILLIETRSVTIKTLKSNYTRLKSGYRLEIGSIIAKVEEIIGQCLNNRGALVNLTDIRTYDEQTFAHSTNVCVLAVLAGISMGLSNEDLRSLGIGALLHDVGKITIDPELLNKPARLNADECEIIREHAQTGFTILSNQDDVPVLAACIAFQHHERWDGSGYPRELRGHEINPLARIVAVADIYEALLGDRPYRT